MKIAEAIVNALTEPVLLLDGSLRATLANPAFLRITGIDLAQLKGKSVEKLIVPEDGEASLTAILSSLLAHKGVVESVELVWTVSPGSRKVFFITARRLAIAENVGDMVLVELLDVTLEKETELRIQTLNDALRVHGRELEEINMELDSFTHSVSHDLRSPLRLTNKIAHLLLEEHGAQLPPGAVEKIDMILNSTDEMGKLIEDLLLFSQVKSEPMRKRRVDMRRLAREAIDDLDDERQGRNVEVQIGELPSCQADRSLLKQVLLNLLGNALKFTRLCERAEIRVGFTQPDGETVYFVRDNGVGFDMSHSESVFLVFHRLHKAHSFEGSGVGLALVKRIIDRHGGRIWAEGKTNHGATFYFTLGAQSAK